MVAVLGLGNLLLKDDGIGIHLVRELKKVCSSPGVNIYEIGTSVFQIPGLLGEEETCILAVDALIGGGEPGTVYRLDLEKIQREQNGAGIVSLHDFRLPDLFKMAAGTAPVCRIFGVEPREIDFGLTLTSALSRRLPFLVQSLLEEVMDLVCERSTCKPPVN